MRSKIRLTDEVGRQAVKAALAQCRDERLRVRLMAVRLAYTGQHSLGEIAQIVNRARSMVGRYLKAFREGGVAGLCLRPRGGFRSGRCQVKASAAQGLMAGLKLGRWKRAKEIQGWLQQEHGVGLSLSGVYGWLRRHRARPKVPRKSHVKKDPKKMEAFKRGLAEELLGLGLPRGQAVRLWVADEHRYGLIGVIRRVWGLRGFRPVAPYHTKYEWGYLYSALEVDGQNRAEAFFAPSVSLEISQIFLTQIAATDPAAQHVVIWDQAGFHQKQGDPGLPDRIHVVSLPPYSPELNPVEKLGDFIKDRVANTIWRTLRDIENAIEEELRPIWQQAERVRSLIGDGWLLDQANASATPLVHFR